MTFKEILAQDVRNVFLNMGEFAEEHIIDGRPMAVQIDDNELLERDKAGTGVHRDGLYKSRILIYVASADFGKRPAIGKLLRLDGERYRVVDCRDEAGLLSIELLSIESGANQS